MAHVTIYDFFNVANFFCNGGNSAGMGVGAANGWSRITVRCRCNAPILHHAPVVIGRHGGAVVSQLDSICARQLALHNIGALHLVVYPLRLFVLAGL